VERFKENLLQNCVVSRVGKSDLSDAEAAAVVRVRHAEGRAGVAASPRSSQ
jgi:hypothetical protein